MIIFSEQTVPDLSTYGILVPAQADRKWQIYKMLTSHPKLSAKQHKWHASWQPWLMTYDDVARVHASEFVNGLFSENPEPYILDAFELVDAMGRYNRYDPNLAKKPLKELRDDILRQVSGTVRVCEVALENGFAYYLGGGMHHAMPDRGAGFCLVHDAVIAIRKLQNEGRIRNAWVVDVDAHKGDGTAELTKNDDSILTFSIHMARGWPLDTNSTFANGIPNPSFTSSTVDVGVESFEAREYNSKLQDGLEKLEQLSSFKPDLVVVIDGSDPYEDDSLPSTSLLKLNLSELFLRDKIVYEFLKSRSIPQAYLLAGGYGPHVWKVHAQFIEWVLMQRHLIG